MNHNPPKAKVGRSNRLGRAIAAAFATAGHPGSN
jgi:hypothetical protein